MPKKTRRPMGQPAERKPLRHAHTRLPEQFERAPDDNWCECCNRYIPKVRVDDLDAGDYKPWEIDYPPFPEAPQLRRASSVRKIRVSYRWDRRQRVPAPGTYLWVRVQRHCSYRECGDIETAAKMLAAYGIQKITANMQFAVCGVGVSGGETRHYTASIHWGRGGRPPEDDVVSGLTDTQYLRLRRLLASLMLGVGKKGGDDEKAKRRKR